ncbi:hypothetical protein LSTR_LSTR006718 [Laodelphax striatellus]|uniref:Uncharacterized protein n=1 Tax=Laodelphax striatellus TaxID=195883 RepID=A0A482X859_LAOST|nr:hypothetical protein LSTR_LSTR006718 [Laodelphax striatellus]
MIEKNFRLAISVGYFIKYQLTMVGSAPTMVVTGNQGSITEREPEKRLLQEREPEKRLLQEREPEKRLLQEREPEKRLLQEREPEKRLLQEREPEKRLLQTQVTPGTERK